MSEPSRAIGFMSKFGLVPDPWQVEVLESGHQRLLLNCCRQAGKSTVVAMLALVQALFERDRTILLLSPSYRQSRELFRTITTFFERMGAPIKKFKNAQGLELGNGSRIIPLPGREDTIRGYSHVSLLLVRDSGRDRLSRLRPLPGRRPA